VGWCVRDGSLPQLRKAMRLSTLLWGGQFNPIVPVDDREYAKRIMEIFQVDALYGVEDDPVIDG
jgi:hypothetical protein